MLGIRALDLESEARTVGSSSGPTTTRDVRHAREALDRARLLSVDQTPRLNEGLLLFATGRRLEGRAILERVVADEPENVDGWLALYTVTSRSGDRRGATAAARRVRALNPLAGDALRR